MVLYSGGLISQKYLFFEFYGMLFDILRYIQSLWISDLVGDIQSSFVRIYQGMGKLWLTLNGISMHERKYVDIASLKNKLRVVAEFK